MTVEEIAPFPDLEKNDEAMFNEAIRHLRELQHHIDDTAQQAAIQLNQLRGNYNYWFNHYGPFLREYALNHAKIDKDGVKAKNYKSIAAGGGVYFRAIPKEIKFDMHYLIEVFNQIPEGLPHIKREITYKIIDAEKLLEACRDMDLNVPVEIIEGDPVGKMSVGTKRAWSPYSSKVMLNKALEGNLKEEEEESEDS